MTNLPPFQWLEDPAHRRSALVLIRRSINAGWLDGPEHAGRRAALVEALARLAGSEAIGDRERNQVAWCLAAIERLRLKAEKAELARSGIRFRGRPVGGGKAG